MDVVPVVVPDVEDAPLELVLFTLTFTEAPFRFTFAEADTFVLRERLLFPFKDVELLVFPVPSRLNASSAEDDPLELELEICTSVFSSFFMVENLRESTKLDRRASSLVTLEEKTKR